MMRRFVGAVALATFLATGALAQSPFIENFTFDPTGLHPGSTGQAFNDYSGQFNLPDLSPGNLGTGFVLGSSFQVWCVDESHFVRNGQTYNVWVTPLSTTDWSHVYVPSGQPGRYAEAAALSTEMSGTAVSANNDNVQYSIWHVLGYNTPPSPTPSGYNFSDYNATTVAADEAIAAANVGNIFLNQWLVITVANRACPAGDLSAGCFQEFITNDLSRPQEFVPEPGTMGLLATGLVGMAGVGIRRRRNRK